MIFVVIFLCIVAICAASDDHLLLSVLANPNSYSRRLHRRDFHPYGFGNKQEYTTSDPSQNIVYQKIQYAPLQTRISAKVNQISTDYTMPTPTLNTVPSPSTDISNIEPYRHLKKHPEQLFVKYDGTKESTLKCFSTERIEEVMSTVSRSPGHNAIYRSYGDPANGNQLYQMSYLTPFSIFQNLNELPTTLPLQLNRKQLKPIPYNQHYVLNPNKLDSDSPPVQKMKRQFSQSGKIHRLHLNIARVYSPGQVPEKSPVFADTYSVNVLPAHSQPFVAPLVHPLGDHNTILFPKRTFSEKKFPFRLT